MRPKAKGNNLFHFNKRTRAKQASKMSRSSSKMDTSASILAASCALILMSIAVPQVVGSDLPLDNHYHFNPCSFNPQCLCSTGGKPFQNWDYIRIILGITAVKKTIWLFKIFNDMRSSFPLYRFPQSKGNIVICFLSLMLITFCAFPNFERENHNFPYTART